MSNGNPYPAIAVPWGMKGQYSHGNQPIQHMIYLFNYASQPWKAQYWIREVIDRLYHATPDGYCGDEDNGQTGNGAH
ncbi:MAG: glycoside hydrolase domain-containing protein [Chitinophagaceae bacterium]